MKHTCRVLWGKQSFFRAVTTLFEVYGDYIKCKSRALTDFFYQKLYKQRDIREPNSDSSPQKSNPPTTLNNPNLYFLSAVIMGVKPRDIYNLFTEKNSYIK